MVEENKLDKPKKKGLTIKTGSFSGIKDVNEDVQTKLINHKAECERMSGKEYPLFQGISYSIQQINGFNYKAKVQIQTDPDEFIHIYFNENEDHPDGEVVDIKLRQTRFTNL